MYGYKSVEVLAAKARGDDSKMVKEAIPYRVVTKDGGADETVDTEGDRVQEGGRLREPSCGPICDSVKK